MLRSFSVLVLITSCLMLTQEEGQARRPGEARNPFAKQAERPGIFTGAVERRKAARELARAPRTESKEVQAAKGSTEKRPAERNESVKKVATNKKAESKKAEAKKAPSTSKAARKVRTVTKGEPGRRGKGGGPLRRRRSVLQPLFGQ